MPISYNSFLASEVFHFYINYNVTTNLLVTIWYTLSIKHDIKNNLHIIHLLDNFIRPQCVTILLIKIMILGIFLRLFNAKLLSLVQISDMLFMDKIYNVVPLLEGISYPLVKC